MRRVAGGGRSEELSIFRAAPRRASLYGPDTYASSASCRLDKGQGRRAGRRPDAVYKNGKQSIFENQVHWARWFLFKAGLIGAPKWGLWGLTPA